MIIFFQNILFLKQFIACSSCFGLFTKTIKGYRTRFWCIFFAWFFHKNVPHLILYQLTKFDVISLSLWKYQAICIIKGYLHYKTITSQNVSSKAQVKVFFYFVEKLCSVLKIFKFCYFQPSPILPNLWHHDEY